LPACLPAHPPATHLAFLPLLPCKLAPTLLFTLVLFPSGYKLADGNHTSIVLCEKGTVSYYPDNGAAGPDPTARIPGDELTCSACASLDPALWAHTFAPRKGMTQCIPCPGGTKPVPLTTSPVTDRCIPCGNGEYRDAYTVRCVCAWV
jgi:hypothetical protein